MPDGKLYIYGSYDLHDEVYCSEEYHVISTPDMKHWTIHGKALCGRDIPWFGKPGVVAHPGIDWEHPSPFCKKLLEESENQNREDDDTKGRNIRPLLYAPDCLEKDGRYYLYFCMADDSEGVAVSDHPAGPFTDPVLLPACGIDPAVFMDRDGQAYYYWGQIYANGAKLSKDLCSLQEDTIKNRLLSEEDHFFHEGSSMRRIGDIYYMVFADMERGRPTALGYATGKSPLGPFTYRGIIIDNVDCGPDSWNNHGSIECVNGQWYVFYHRSSRGGRRWRRLCAEKIEILPDGSIPEVKMTSQGIGPAIGPDESLYGYQACSLTGHCFINVSSDEGAEHEILTGICAGDSVVFRYVSSNTGYSGIWISMRGEGCVEIRFGDQLAGRISANGAKDVWQEYHSPVSVPPGYYELSLTFIGSNHLEVDYLRFASGK